MPTHLPARPYRRTQAQIAAEGPCTDERTNRMRAAFQAGYENKGGFPVRLPHPGNSHTLMIGSEKWRESQQRRAPQCCSMLGPTWHPSTGWAYPDSPAFWKYVEVYKVKLPVTVVASIPPMDPQPMWVRKYTSPPDQKPLDVVRDLGFYRPKLFRILQMWGATFQDPPEYEPWYWRKLKKMMTADVLWSPEDWPVGWRDERKMRDLAAKLKLENYGWAPHADLPNTIIPPRYNAARAQRVAWERFREAWDEWARLCPAKRTFWPTSEVIQSLPGATWLPSMGLRGDSPTRGLRGDSIPPFRWPVHPLRSRPFSLYYGPELRPIGDCRRYDADGSVRPAIDTGFRVGAWRLRVLTGFAQSCTFAPKHPQIAPSSVL